MKFMNEGLEKDTVKDRLFDFVVEQLHNAFDNIAILASASVEGYDAEWCPAEISEVDDNFIESTITKLAKQEVDVLMQNCSLNESLDEDYGNELLLKKFTTIEIPYWCNYINERKSKFSDKDQKQLVFACMDFDDAIQAVLKNYDDAIEFLDESLFESLDGDALSGPSEGADYGFASMINTAIQDEFKTIELYNDISLQAKQEGNDAIVAVVDDINTEENKHVGQLQELLKTLSPNAEAIDQGAEEGAEQIADSE